jgi:hypothetical protein
LSNFVQFVREWLEEGIKGASEDFLYSTFVLEKVAYSLDEERVSTRLLLLPLDNFDGELSGEC